MYQVLLDSAPNPDFRQCCKPAPRVIVEAESFKQASEKCRAYIAKYDIGGGNWIGGQVYKFYGKRKRLVATISFNGRVWRPGVFPTKEIIID